MTCVVYVGPALLVHYCSLIRISYHFPLYIQQVALHVSLHHGPCYTVKMVLDHGVSNILYKRAIFMYTGKSKMENLLSLNPKLEVTSATEKLTVNENCGNDQQLRTNISQSTRPLPDVLYKGDNYVAINKLWDLKINSDDREEMTTEHQLRKLFPDLVDPKCAHAFRYVHRLDYATSGVLCLALNRVAAKHLSAAFKHKQVTKYYLALVRGHVDDDLVFMDAPQGDLEDQEWPRRRCTPAHPACVDPRPTQTLMVSLDRGTYDGQPVTKVLLKPFTGRQHQLRVHCADQGHTIVGDYTYSNRQDTGPDRMMLHSHRLIANMKFESLNITAPDPFTPGLLGNKWIVGETCRTYAEAVSMAENFILSNHIRDNQVVKS